MQHMARLIPLIASVLVLTSCNKPGDFFYVYPVSQHISYAEPIKQMLGSNQLDILWVIDNSGSMMSHQQDVMNNMNTFISALTTNNALDWKSGLISTSDGEPPYAGFTPGTELLSSDPLVGQKFISAVARLGTMGDGTEMTFDPVVDVLTQYPTFRRPGAAFAIIVISDAPEQSYTNTATTFIKFLTQTGGGSLAQTYFYGFLNPDDWCAATDDDWYWTGSPFEAVTNAIQGHVYKLCDPNFAANLQDLGTNLGKEVSMSRIYLKQIPRANTIHIIYQGQDVPGGPQSQGGYWVYRQDINAIEFSSLAFAPSQNASVQVVYDVDNGVQN